MQIDLKENVDDLYRESAFITVHMPMTDETKGMVNAAAFAKMTKGVRVLNCARGGIINEADLFAAIQSGHVGGAALDVYEVEPPPADFPLRQLPQVIMTPHLGASTQEAQENVGIEVAEAIIDFLVNGAVRNAVNLPNLDVQTYQVVKPFLVLGEKLGRLLAQLAPKRNDRIVITYGGKAAQLPTDPITRAVLKGFLELSGGKEVNQVNVRSAAAALGLDDRGNQIQRSDRLQRMAPCRRSFPARRKSPPAAAFLARRACRASSAFSASRSKSSPKASSS